MLAGCRGHGCGNLADGLSWSCHDGGRDALINPKRYRHLGRRDGIIWMAVVEVDRSWDQRMTPVEFIRVIKDLRVKESLPHVSRLFLVMVSKKKIELTMGARKPSS